MATAVASLGISFVARTNKWDKGAKKILGDLKKVGLAALGVGAAFGGLIKASIDVADALGKASKRAGVTVEELQALRFAAERSGSSAETMDRGLATLSKRLGEAKLGTGALASFLGRYDQSLLDALVNTTSTGEAVNLLADAMQDAGTQADRNAIAAAAFSKSLGLDLVLALQGGSEGLREFDKEARKTSRFMTKQMVEDSEKAGDAFDNLAHSIKGTAFAMGATFADELAATADFLRTALPNAIKAAAATFLTLVRVAAASAAAIKQFFSGNFAGAAELGSLTFGDIFKQAVDDVDKAFARPESGQGSGSAGASGESQKDSEAAAATAQATTEMRGLMERQNELSSQVVDGIRQITNQPAVAG
ncbi:MAG: hypothetical protein U5S82_00335 [Gammaproteobacteria bacterium]|nr:hypothetical protein [Gammaproteobacteria bacterium]